MCLHLGYVRLLYSSSKKMLHFDMLCKNCSSKVFEHIYTIEGFDIEKCSTCNLVRTRQKPKEKYSEYHRDENEYTKDEVLFRNIFQKRFNIISNCFSPSASVKGRFRTKSGMTKHTTSKVVDSRSESGMTKKILDIGASTGTMLSIFKDAGWDVWGIEPSKTSVVIAKKRGIKMSHGFFENVKLPSNHFDVVIMNHTFEHVEDPLKVLTKIKRVLKKGGIVYLDVPNFGSWNATVMKEKWGYLMPTEHTFHYTPDTLKMLVAKSGFKVLWWGSWSGIFDVGRPVGKLWYELSHFRLSFIKDAVRIPLNIFSTLTKRGTSVAIIGQKM